MDKGSRHLWYCHLWSLLDLASVVVLVGLGKRKVPRQKVRGPSLLTECHLLRGDSFPVKGFFLC